MMLCSCKEQKWSGIMRRLSDVKIDAVKLHGITFDD